jgi:hypothetical protein
MHLSALRRLLFRSLLRHFFHTFRPTLHHMPKTSRHSPSRISLRSERKLSAQHVCAAARPQASGHDSWE